MLTLRKEDPAEVALDGLIAEVALYIGDMLVRAHVEILLITYTTTAVAVKSIPAAPSYFRSFLE